MKPKKLLNIIFIFIILFIISFSGYALSSSACEIGIHLNSDGDIVAVRKCDDKYENMYNSYDKEIEIEGKIYRFTEMCDYEGNNCISILRDTKKIKM